MCIVWFTVLGFSFTVYFACGDICIVYDFLWYVAAFSIHRLLSLWWLVKPDPGFAKSPHIGQGIFVLSGFLSCWDDSGSCIIAIVAIFTFLN